MAPRRIKQKKTGPGGTIRLRYMGKKYPEQAGKMLLIADLSDLTGLTRKIIYDRWFHAGKPTTIDDSILRPVQEEKRRARRIPSWHETETKGDLVARALLRF